jgi:hypothetical protein
VNIMYEAAIWSDRFFNSDEAESMGGVLDPDEVLGKAKEFVENNPDSPFAPEWYVKDFLKRV